MNDILLDKYIKNLRENIFLTMELAGMSYNQVRLMPVYELTQYLEWKIRYDNDKERAKSKSLDNLK